MFKNIPALAPNLVFRGNEIYSNTLGQSETLSFEGNVTGFEVSGNSVHDNNNIGIGFIGYEGVCSVASLDYARNGVCRSNLVWNNSDASNPAYPANDYSADGIYSDGGSNVLMELNLVHYCDLGIELACEHAGHAAWACVCRDNLIWSNYTTGISLGGYSASVGQTINCVISHNTLYHNDTRQSGTGELELQYAPTGNSITHNALECPINPRSHKDETLREIFSNGSASGSICRVIDTHEKLAAFLPVVTSASWLALDTEADSLHAYPEKVCLIQISTAAGDRLVDPLAGIDINPFLDALVGRELIFHAADYDLRLLRKHHEFTPALIFDTMLAARLLGERQFGLSSLVEKFLGVKLDKGSQKADWARRPLTEKMEVYARNDTHYLKPLELKLNAELQAKGRLEWHQESCAQLIVECSRPFLVNEDEVWRIKGSTFLERPALAVLRELWHWREREALAANRPPFFVLAHEKMVQISAAVAEKSPFEPLIPLRMHPRRKDNLMAAIHASRAIPPEKFPEKIHYHSQRPTEAEFRRFREIQKRRDKHAHDLGIDPTIIAPKSVLGDLARDWDKYAAELMKWQRELLK